MAACFIINISSNINFICKADLPPYQIEVEADEGYYE
jgi:hypothetical protein